MAIVLLSQSHPHCKGFTLLNLSIPCVFSMKLPVWKAFSSKDGDSWSYPVCVRRYRAPFTSPPPIPYTIMEPSDKPPSFSNLQAPKAFSFQDVFGLLSPIAQNVSLKSFLCKNTIKRILHTTLYVNNFSLIKWLCKMTWEASQIEPFFDASLAISSWQQHNHGCPSSSCAYIQMHGKKRTTCPDDDVFLSSGLGMNRILLLTFQINTKLNSKKKKTQEILLLL